MNGTCTVDGCDTDDVHARGMCHTHYHRIWRSGELEPLNVERQIEELTELTRRDTDECVLWPHFLNSRGYGMVWNAGGSRFVHQLSCREFHGAPQPGQEVAHSCARPACVNPRHLRWATHLENMRDRTYPRGEATLTHKLTAGQVRAIRHRSSLGARRSDLGAEYGVSAQTILDIVRYRTWSWLQ